MNTQDNTQAPVNDVNEPALRRWINEQYEGAASCASWTLQECLDFAAEHHTMGVEAFRQTPYRAYSIYREATPEARATADAVFNAVRNSASPLLGMEAQHDTGLVGCAFTWYDGGKYRVTINPTGQPVRLYRYEYTGRWARDPEDGELYEDGTWRTVRNFSRDRAGRVLARGLADVPGALPWERAAKS